MCWWCMQWQMGEEIEVYAKQRKGAHAGEVYQGRFNLTFQYILPAASSGVKMSPQDFLRSAHASAQSIKLWQAALYIAGDQKV